MNLKEILDDWAQKLSEKASENNTPLQESTDAFKAVQAYYATQQKGRKKSEDDDPPDADGFTFADGVVNGGSAQPAPRLPARRNS